MNEQVIHAIILHNNEINNCECQSRFLGQLLLTGKHFALYLPITFCIKSCCHRYTAFLPSFDYCLEDCFAFSQKYWGPTIWLQLHNRKIFISTLNFIQPNANNYQNGKFFKRSKYYESKQKQQKLQKRPKGRKKFNHK